MANFVKSDIEALENAVRLLEHPGLMARLADVVGAPIEKGFGMLRRTGGRRSAG